MKSAESSAGFAPETCAMHAGALSMIAGTAGHLLDSVELVGAHPPALLALGPGHARAHEAEHDRQADQEGEHLTTHSRADPVAGSGAVGERRQLAWQEHLR